MAVSYDISDKIKNAFAQKLINDFDVTRVSGLNTRPIITKTITNKTPEPYIYVQSVGSNETWVTKDSESREYNLVFQIVVKHRTNRGTHVQREEISNEVLRIVATDVENYPDLSSNGFQIQVVDTGAIVKYDTVEKGARYYIANIPVNVTAALDEEAAGDENPVQALTKTYANWEFTPSGNNMETYDSGTITYANTYASDNNGWDFTGVVYTNSGSGSLADNVLTVTSSDGNTEVDGVISYELESDNSQTTTLSHVDAHNRIVSFRYGSMPPVNNAKPVFSDDSAATVGLRDFDNWTGTNQTLDFGTVNPNGDTITLQGDAGDYLYLITSSDVNNITNISHAVAGATENLLSHFDTVQTIGQYKVYIWTRALSFDTNINVTITV